MIPTNVGFLGLFHNFVYNNFPAVPNSFSDLVSLYAESTIPSFFSSAISITLRNISPSLVLVRSKRRAPEVENPRCQVSVPKMRESVSGWIALVFDDGSILSDPVRMTEMDDRPRRVSELMLRIIRFLTLFVGYCTDYEQGRRHNR